MPTEPLLTEPGHVNEPRLAQDLSAMLTQVVAKRRPLIVRRDGADLAAVIPLEDLEKIREILAREEVEKKAAQLAKDRAGPVPRPPQQWFDDTDNPFEPEPAP